MRALHTLWARVSNFKGGTEKCYNTTNMVHILQINMPRSAIAHEFLTQFAGVVKADLVLISEQYRNKDPTLWHLDGIRFRILAEDVALIGFDV